MSFLFCCGRRRTEFSLISTEQRLVTLETEVARLQKEIISLRAVADQEQQHRHVRTSSMFLTPTACPPSALSTSSISALPLFPLTSTATVNTTTNITTHTDSANTASGETIVKPAMLSAPFTPLSALLSSPLSTTATVALSSSSPLIPSPPVAPPFTPFLNSQRTSFLPSLHSTSIATLSLSPISTPIFSTTASTTTSSALSPDGHVSTSSLTSALDSLIMTIQPPPPAPSLLPSLSSPLPSLLPKPKRAVPSRVLRPLSSPAANRGLDLTDIANVKLRKPRSVRKPMESGISLDAILNVKLRARTRSSQRNSQMATSQRKRGRLSTPANKENVDTFFKDALRMKFKRLREQEEADDLEWHDQKKNRNTLDTPF